MMIECAFTAPISTVLYSPLNASLPLSLIIPTFSSNPPQALNFPSLFFPVLLKFSFPAPFPAALALNSSKLCYPPPPFFLISSYPFWFSWRAQIAFKLPKMQDPYIPEQLNLMLGEHHRKLPPIVEITSPERRTVYQSLQNYQSKYLWGRYGGQGSGTQAGDEGRCMNNVCTPGAGNCIRQKIHDVRGEDHQQRSNDADPVFNAYRPESSKVRERMYTFGDDQYCLINMVNAHAQNNRKMLRVVTCKQPMGDTDDKHASLGKNTLISAENETCTGLRILNKDKSCSILGRKKNGLLISPPAQPPNYEAEFTESILGPRPHTQGNLSLIAKHSNYLPIPLKMNFTDEQLLAQFAALSAEDGDSQDLASIPQQPVRKWRWEECLLMRVTSQNVITESAFSSALRRSWNVHPDTVIEGLGSNYFLVQFLIPMEMLRIIAKGIWKLNKGDIVVTRQAKGEMDLVEPYIDEADCWVELHGIPPDSWDSDCVSSLLRQVGTPLTEVATFFLGNKRVYRQKLRVSIVEPLKPKVPLKHRVYGICWIFVVYENLANICRFCAIIGHEHSLCPVRYRLVQMKQQEQYQEQLGDKQIPETQVGKWINDRTMVPRNEVKGPTISSPNSGMGSISKEKDADKNKRTEKNLKRPINLNDGGMAMLFIDGSMQGQSQSRVEEVHYNQHLNCKRARETNPNSSPSSQ